MAQKTEECKPLVVVRIRGTVSAQREARETLELLHLTHTNHAVLIDSRPAYKGMLQRINSYVTYGEPTKETVVYDAAETCSLSRRQKTNRRIHHKNRLQTIDDLAEAIVNCKVQYGKLPRHTSTLPTASTKQRLQRQNQKRLQSRRRSRLPRRSNKRTSATHGLNNQRSIPYYFFVMLLLLA